MAGRNDNENPFVFIITMMALVFFLPVWEYYITTSENIITRFFGYVVFIVGGAICVNLLWELVLG